MATVQVEPKLPDITPVQSLTGWRREFCVELLVDGGARIFVRAVEKSSFKAAELQRAILFHRLDSRGRDLEGCVETIRPDPGSPDRHGPADPARQGKPVRLAGVRPRCVGTCAARNRSLGEAPILTTDDLAMRVSHEDVVSRTARQVDS